MIKWYSHIPNFQDSSADLHLSCRTFKGPENSTGLKEIEETFIPNKPANIHNHTYNHEHGNLEMGSKPNAL